MADYECNKQTVKRFIVYSSFRGVVAVFLDFEAKNTAQKRDTVTPSVLSISRRENYGNLLKYPMETCIAAITLKLKDSRYIYAYFIWLRIFPSSSSAFPASSYFPLPIRFL